MHDHYHFHAFKVLPNVGKLEHRYIVRATYERAEETVAAEMGYTVQASSCDDRRCLGPEPIPRSSSL